MSKNTEIAITLEKQSVKKDVEKLVQHTPQQNFPFRRNRISKLRSIIPAPICKMPSIKHNNYPQREKQKTAFRN